MRRVNFSITRFFPAVVAANTSGLFQSFRFHAVGARDYRNELAEFAQLPWQQWNDKGLDPVKFVREVKAREFYRGDGVLLIKLLLECCRMVINHSDLKMEQIDKAAVDDYAHQVLNVIGSEAGFDRIYWRGPDEDQLDGVASIGEKILAKFAAEKKEGPAVDMVKAIDKLYGYVLTMNLKDSAPAAEQPRF